MVNLTDNEARMLDLCLNYRDRASQLADNYSETGVAEAMAALGWTAQQVGGLVSSLEQKGMGYMDEEGADIFWLTEDGVNAIFDHKQAQQG